MLGSRANFNLDEYTVFPTTTYRSQNLLNKEIVQQFKDDSKVLNVEDPRKKSIIYKYTLFEQAADLQALLSSSCCCQKNL